MKEDELEGIISSEDIYVRPHYTQPHNIHVNTGNPALDYHLVQKTHARLKYEAKRRKSKQSRRIP